MTSTTSSDNTRMPGNAIVKTDGVVVADPTRRGSEMNNSSRAVMNVSRSRYPFSVVWTPIPILTWLFPVIGHMGIAYSTGVIRDFAGPFYVSEDSMAFGRPTKYWVLDPDLAQGGVQGWDRAVYEASEEYKGRMHNLCCDNCHSHVAFALNTMRYKGSNAWNMIWLWLGMLLYGKYVNFAAFLKTWVPFCIIVTLVATFTLVRFT